MVSLKATLGFPATTGQLYSVRILCDVKKRAENNFTQTSINKSNISVKKSNKEQQHIIRSLSKDGKEVYKKRDARTELLFSLYKPITILPFSWSLIRHSLIRHSRVHSSEQSQWHGVEGGQEVEARVDKWKKKNNVFCPP